MTETSMPSSGQSAYPPQQRPPAHTSSAWTGWIGFAGIMLIIIGVFQFIAGLIAIFQHGFYAVSKSGLPVHLSYTGWGWILFLLALLNVSAGFGIFTGATWARVWAIGSATLSFIANLGFTSAYPVWTVMLLALDVIVIYALCVHWRDAQSSYF